MANKLKLLILAIDGATPRFIDSRKTELPHFHTLINEGTSGIVAGPPFSCDRWFTYYTGLSPQEHGMEAMRLSTVGRVTLTSSKARKFLWDYITQAGLRFGMLGGLGCEPPAKVDGFWVNFHYDQFYPEKARQFCSNLWIPAAPFPICGEMGTTPWEELDAETVIKTLEQYDWNLLLAWSKQRQLRQREMLSDLMAQWPVDVLWYYVFELDWCQHLAAHRPDILTTCYQNIDESLGYLKKKYRPRTTLVISDHGVTQLGEDIPYPGLKVLPGKGACLPLENKKTFWTGEHHADSFYALAGPGVPKGSDKGIEFTQVFPLIMNRLGISLPPSLSSEPAESRRLWKIRAPFYAQLQWAKRKDLLAAMISCCEVTKKDRVLDLGTGTGAVACALSPHVGHVIGVDSEPAMLEQASAACPNVEFREMDVLQLDLPDGGFDLVTARMVLHHVADVSRALAEVRRVLKSGGRIVLCEGVPPSPLVLEQYIKIFALKEPGRNIFTEEKLIELLNKAGFINIRLHSFNIPQVSMKNWLSASGLPAEVCLQIAELHRRADADFWESYNMKESGDDLLMDWKFAVVTGFR